MTERQGVEIDYCPKCRGVWLDRGELDKIVERSLAPSMVAAVPTPPLQAPPSAPGYSHAYPDSHGHYRKKSWLGELFD